MFYKKYLISGLLVACAIPASAALTTFCTVGPALLCPETGSSSAAASSAFNTATASDTFTNISFTAGSLGTSYTDSGTGLEFNDLLGLIGTASPSGWPSGTAIDSTAAGSVSTIALTVPSGVSAIDFYVGVSLLYSNFTISVTDSNGATFTDGYFYQSSLAPFFFGVTTSGTFTNLTITDQTPGNLNQITLDDISLGSAGSDAPAVPETETLLSVGTGLLALGFARRWMPGSGAKLQAL